MKSYPELFNEFVDQQLEIILAAESSIIENAIQWHSKMHGEEHGHVCEKNFISAFHIAISNKLEQIAVQVERSNRSSMN